MHRRARSSLSSSVKVGAVSLPIVSDSGFSYGCCIKVGDGVVGEKRVVVGFGYLALCIDHPLDHAHDAGEIVVKVREERRLTQASMRRSGADFVRHDILRGVIDAACSLERKGSAQAARSSMLRKSHTFPIRFLHQTCL